MKVVFAADLHGKKKLYKQLDELVKIQAPEVVVLGGDLFPEGKEAKDSPVVQKQFVENDFRSRMEGYRSFGVREFLIIMGNHDLSLCEQAVQDMESKGLCQYIHGKPTVLDGTACFAGYSYSPPSPYPLRDFDKKDSKDEEVDRLCLLQDNKGFVSSGLDVVKINNWEFFETRGTIQEDLTELAAKLEPDGFFFVGHAPPLCEYLDMETSSLHVGSPAVRAFIGSARPTLSLHGHIHNSPKHSGYYLEVVEGVPCVQPGQDDENLHGVFFDTEDPVRSLRHTVLDQK